MYVSLLLSEYQKEAAVNIYSNSYPRAYSNLLVKFGVALEFASGFCTSPTGFLRESETYCQKPSRSFRKWILHCYGGINTPVLGCACTRTKQLWVFCFKPESTPSDSGHGHLWNSLGPTTMESCQERAGVAYWKKANDLRSTLGWAESLQRTLYTQAARPVLAFTETGKASEWKQNFWASKCCVGQEAQITWGLPSHPRRCFSRETSKTILRNYSYGIFQKQFLLLSFLFP